MNYHHIGRVDISLLYAGFVDRKRLKELKDDDDALFTISTHDGYLDLLEQGKTLYHWLDPDHAMIVEMKNGSPVAFIAGPRETTILKEIEEKLKSKLGGYTHAKFFFPTETSDTSQDNQA